MPDLGALAVGAAAATGVAALAAADGGYFPPSWGWTALAGLWIAAAWLEGGPKGSPPLCYKERGGQPG